MKTYLDVLLLVLGVVAYVLAGCTNQAVSESPIFTAAPAPTFTPQPLATATPPSTLTPITTNASPQRKTPTLTTAAAPPVPASTAVSILPVVLPPNMRPTANPFLNMSLEAINRLPGQLFFSIRSWDGFSGDIWLINNGHPPQLLITNAALPIPSPQGDKLVFSGETKIEVSVGEYSTMTLLRNTAWVTNLNCSTESGICQASDELLTLGLNAVDMEWSPDGSLVAFTTAGNDGKVWRSEKLYMADVNTGVVHTLLEKDGGSPEFSSDGQWIMMRRPEKGYFHGILSLVSTDGSEQRVLYRMFEDDVVGWLPYWLPDNNVSVILTKSGNEFNVQQYLIPTNGAPVLVGSYPETPHEMLFSPDQTRMIYRAKDDAGWLHFADADGSNVVTIPGTDEQFHAVAWSPNSRHVVLCRSNEDLVIPPQPCDGKMIVANYIVSDELNSVPIIKPMDYHFRLWVDSNSYLAVSSPELSSVEVRHIWLEGNNDFLFDLAYVDVFTLHYLKE